MKFTKHLISLFFMASMLWACSAEDGAPGPEGPQGEQGEQGAQGDQGETGTANVIYSAWIAADFETGGASETNQQLIRSFGPTGAVSFNLEEDIMLVYGRRSSGAISETVYQLPHILISQEEFYSFSVRTFSNGSSLYIDVSTLDGGTNLFTFFDDFRYIIIPGGIPASSARISTDFSAMSYDEITDYFNIPK